MDKNEEQILVMKRSDLNPEFQGFLDVEKFPFNPDMEKIYVKRRGDMEEDPTYKQLISYAVVKNQKDEILVYTRLTGGGETRLHGQSSIGVGGHMNPDETLRGNELLLDNTLREIEEEIGITPEQIKDLKLIGFVNDDTNPVGLVHFGLVYQIVVDESDVCVQETDTLSVQFVQPTALSSYNLETWSKFIGESYGY